MSTAKMDYSMQYESTLLLSLYRTMVRIRLCEESLVEPILKREIRCPCHLCSGEEAVAVGICAALDEKDYIFGNHRSHGHFIAKGGSLLELVAEIYGSKNGCSRGRGGSMHLIDPEVGLLGSVPIVAGTVSLAMGAALAGWIREDGRVSVSFFGDGDTGEGVLYECLNFSALKKLPMLFVCENNLYATHMPIRECRVEKEIFKIGESFGIESWRVDGMNVLEVYEEATKAIDQCRQGRGPVLLECSTYRFRGHVGPDDNIQGAHKDIRPQEEVEEWLKKDPIKRLEKYLLENEIAKSMQLKSIVKEVEEEVAVAHRFAKAGPFPEAKELNHYVFKENSIL